MTLIPQTSRRDFFQLMAFAAGSGSLGAFQQQETEAFSRTGGIVHGRDPHSWFSRAGLGLFLCWGPCSVGEVEVGWGMFRDVGAPNRYWPPEKYHEMCARFNPAKYDPDLWLRAAAKAGIRYAVFITRHHDGYALWPSEYGNFGTTQLMHGRDLVKPYVEACRKNGIRVGFYYSPNDWNFNPPGWPHYGFPLRDPNFLYRRPEQTRGLPRFDDITPAEAQKYFEVIYAYVKGQVGELLTRYGKIDLLWWDGFDWPDILDDHGREMQDYVRKLQPDIVLNDRWRLWSKRPRFGDYSTEFENRRPARQPAGMWEQCEAVCGGWSYRGPKAACKSTAYLLDQLIEDRTWGGNYLPSFGPTADGTMAPDYYRICEELAGWMKHSGESVHDVDPGPYPSRSSVPVTVKGTTWYVFLTTSWQGSAALRLERPPKAARHLRTGHAVPWTQNGNQFTLAFPAALRSDLPEVVALDLS